MKTSLQNWDNCCVQSDHSHAFISQTFHSYSHIYCEKLMMLQNNACAAELS